MGDQHAIEDGLPVSPAGGTEPIAIIGIGCRLDGHYESLDWAFSACLAADQRRPLCPRDSDAVCAVLAQSGRDLRSHSN